MIPWMNYFHFGVFAVLPTRPRYLHFFTCISLSTFFTLCNLQTHRGPLCFALVSLLTRWFLPMSVKVLHTNLLLALPLLDPISIYEFIQQWPTSAYRVDFWNLKCWYLIWCLFQHFYKTLGAFNYIIDFSNFVALA